jgi:hypothetical protein
LSLERSKLVSGVRLLCDERPDEPLPNGLPSSLIFKVLVGLEDEMLRDLDLSDQNRRVNPTPMEIVLSDGGEPYTLTAQDFNAPAFAYLGVDDVRYPVEVTNHDSLIQRGIDGQLAVAFTGTPPKGFLSWTPESSQTLYVFYDRTQTDATMSGTTEIGNLYDSYLELQATAQCREFLKMDVGDVLRRRLDKSERQWQRSVKASRAQGQVSKTSAFSHHPD